MFVFLVSSATASAGVTQLVVCCHARWRLSANPDPHFGGRASEMIVRGLVALGVSIRVLLMNGRVNLRSGSTYWLWCGIVCQSCCSNGSSESLHLSST